MEVRKISGGGYAGSPYLSATDCKETSYSEVAKVVGEKGANTDSRVIGLTTLPYSGSLSYGIAARYSPMSTAKDPIVQVTSNYGGENVSIEVHVNEVNPRNASMLEMFALCSYADDQGMTGIGGMGSFTKMKAFRNNAVLNGYCKNIGSPEEYINEKQDWEQMLGRMAEEYLQAGIYKQYQDGMQMLNFLEKCPGRADAARTGSDLSESLWQAIAERKDEIREKLKRGDTEETFQIGSCSFTLKEWDRLMEEFDELQEEIRLMMEEEEEEQERERDALS